MQTRSQNQAPSQIPFPDCDRRGDPSIALEKLFNQLLG